MVMERQNHINSDNAIITDNIILSELLWLLRVLSDKNYPNS